MVVQSRKPHTHSTLRGDVPSRMAADLAATAAHCDDDIKQRTTSSRSPPAHVGIVGAGVAGLRCADVLLKHGVRVTILEGRTRVGGRVRSSLSMSVSLQSLTAGSSPRRIWTGTWLICTPRPTPGPTK
jgi:NADPH-dependent 2,4-dienoyl-CoA reductase/sulfur reductase-like enzyme